MVDLFITPGGDLRILEETGTAVADQAADTATASVAALAPAPYEITFTSYSLDECAIELGVYFIALTLCMFLLLDQVRGKPRNLGNYLLARRLEIFREDDRNSKAVADFLLAASYFYLVVPLLTLFGWIALLVYDKIQEEESLLAPFCLFIVGLGFIIFGLNALRMRWMNYRVKKVNLCALLTCFILMTLYQVLVIFGIEHTEKFFPYSALFLNFNAILLGALIYFSKYSAVKDVSHVLEKWFPKSGEGLDRARDADLLEELQEQVDDENYRTTFEDLTDVLTVQRVSDAKFRAVMGEGAVQSFGKLPSKKKVAIQAGIILLSYLVLAAYSIVLYLFDDRNKMGIITSISVALMDGFNYLLYKSDRVDSPAQIVVLLIINRVMMVSLGQSYWIYGYVGLYIIYSLAFVSQISRNRFPFENDIVHQVVTFESFMKDLSKKGQRGLTKEQLAANYRKNFGSPGVLLAILSIFYFVLVAILSAINGKIQGVNVENYTTTRVTYQEATAPASTATADDATTENATVVQEPVLVERSFAPWQVAGYSILLVLSFYFLVSTYRILVRKIQRVENQGQVGSALDFFLKYISQVNLYLLLSWFACVLWASLGFWVTGWFEWISFGIFGSACVLNFSEAYVYFALNEYQVFQDIEKLNRWVDRHNRQIEEMEQKRAKIQEQLADGTLLLPPLPPDQPEKPAGPMVPKDPGQPTDPEQPAQPAAPEEEDQAAAQAEQQAQMQEMMRQQQERQRLEQEAEQARLDGDEALRKKREEEARAMQEQRKMEQEQQAQQKKKAEEERKRAQAAEAQRQKQEEAKRREQNNQNASSVAPNSVGSKMNVHGVGAQYSGQMQAAEIVQRNHNKGFQDDEMYEGGDGAAEATIETLPQPVDNQSQAAPAAGGPMIIDLDTAENDPNGMKKIAQYRVHRVADWRLRHKNWFEGLKAGQLRPHDRQFLIAAALSIVAWLAMMIAFIIDMGAIGVVYSFPFVYVAISTIIASSVIYQSRTFKKNELITWASVNALYLIIGVAWFIWDFRNDFSDFSYGNVGAEATTDAEAAAQLAQQQATDFFFAYILLAPTLAHGVVFVMRLIDRGLEGFDAVFKGMGIAFFSGILLMILATFVFIRWQEGLVFLGAILGMLYACIQVGLYFKNDGFMELVWERMNKTIIVLGVLAAAVVSVFDDSLSAFEGISYSLAVALFLLWCYAAFHFLKDSGESARKPVYYSGALFPIYKFDPKTHHVKEHSGPLISWLIGLSLLTFWGFYMNASVTPAWFGAVVTICIELVILMSTMYLRTLTLDCLKGTVDFMTADIAKNAWLETKRVYYKSKGAFSRHEVLTYRRAWVRRYCVESYLASLQRKKIEKPIKEIKQEVKDELYVIPPGGGGPTKKEFYQAKVSEFLPPQYNIEDITDLCHYSYDLDGRVHECALEELECVVQFVMLAVQNTQIRQDQEHKAYLRFLESKKDVLYALGMDILIPSKGTMFQRVQAVREQVEMLPENQQTIFKQLEVLYTQELEAAGASSAQAKAVEQAKADDRDRLAGELRKQKEEELARLQETLDTGGGDAIDLDADIDSMPDCLPKYKIIVERAKQRGQKFSDARFPPNEASLGPELAGTPDGWERMSEHMQKEGGHVLFEDGVETNDVEQGEMGDCYYCSALAVLGSALTRDKFVTLESDDEFQRCGAFCVKFYDGGKEDYVIIDDFLPLRGGDFVFARTPTLKEVWPNILEKAYAKKYGSFSVICGGFVDVALAELTNGIPETMNRADNQNLKKWWDQLMEYYKAGYCLGAGTPSHEDGDRAKSATGVVQGHAYSIIKLVEVDKLKLICVRNPWGQGEWTGDWSDDSELWTTRMKNLTGQQDFANDGIFWMDFNDFVVEFDDVYVCKQFKPEDGWHSAIMHDKWEGKYAAGLPTRDNQDCVIGQNPQYGLTVSKPGNGYLVLRMKEKENSYKAKLKGYFFVQSYDGLPLKSNGDMRGSLQVASHGPSPYAQLPEPITFPKTLKYPYTFTCLVANMEPGAAGEGGFSLQIYTKDPTMEVNKLN